MVSTRCKQAVKTELKKMGLHFVFVELGQVEILEDLSPAEIKQLTDRLFLSGLVMMADKKALLVDRVTEAVRLMLNQHDGPSKLSVSAYISAEVGKDYAMLANLFSEVKGITISQYVLEQKVERIKELLYHKEFTITDIAHKMNYSSVAHLCNQFKKITGLTPGVFNLLKNPAQEKIPPQKTFNSIT